MNIKYTLVQVLSCNMCDTPVKDAVVLGRRMNCSQGLIPRKKIGISTTIMKCRNCSLVFPNPIPVPENLSFHYGTPPESYWTADYFEIKDDYFVHELAAFNELYPSDEGLIALDVGAGIGKCMIALERSGFTAFGIEPSQPFYERAVKKMGISNERLTNATIEDAEYPAEFFDFITFGAVLEHLYNPSASIEKAMRWLKPGGLIHIEVPSSKWLTNKLYNLLYRLQGLDYVGNVSPMHSPFHIYEFGLDSFERHSEKANYTIAKYNYHVCDTYLPGVFDFILKPVMEKTETGMQLTVWLRKR